MSDAVIMDLAILGGLLLAGGLLVWPRLARSEMWRATITPLASIIGSGFLVLGPITVDSFGGYAVVAMVVLCLLAYVFGKAIRFNILAIERAGNEDAPLVRKVERVASWALAFAYVISVAYYLNLFGAFAARIVHAETGALSQVITTAVYLFILAAGWTGGFALLERLEQISVSLKLAIIAALICGMAWFVRIGWEAGTLASNHAKLDGFAAMQLLFGLVITVQGFETSRYLGDHYDAKMRVRSMKLAQWTATLIYLSYVALLSLSFASDRFALTETAIIDMMKAVSPILPPLLIVAALGAQFSAAIADAGGSGGLVEELTHGRFGARQAYVLLVAVGLAVTWAFDVFRIINYASRAFALYYTLQAALAMMRARQEGRMWHVAGFALLTILGVAVTFLSVPVEG